MAKIQNADRLRRKLEALPDDVRDALLPTMEEGAEQMTSLMRHLVPVLKKRHKGQRAGELRDSITWRYKETPGKDMEILILAGATNPEGPYYARFVEFGVHAQKKGQVRVSFSKKGRRRRRRISKRTVGYIPAQPFFFPAYLAYKRSVGAQMTKAAKAGIKKNADRS